MHHVTSNAWYLQWYVLLGVTIFLYGFAYAWYMALGATTPIAWVKWQLRKRQKARVYAQQVAAREERLRVIAQQSAEFERLKAEKRAEIERQRAAKRGVITIDAEPETASTTSAT